MLFLNPDGTVKTVTTTVDSRNNGPALGTADILWDVAAVGDLDADGVRDLAVVAQDVLDDPTTAFTFVRMNPDGTIKGYQIQNIATTEQPLLASLNTRGDINGDGRMELAFGLPLQGGFSDPSGIVRVLTLEKAPSHAAAPTTPIVDRSLSISRTRRPTIRWSESPRATSDEIWIKDSETRAVLVNSVNVATNSYRPAADLPMHRLQISIRAKNEIGKSAWTANYNLTIARIVNTNPVATGMDRRPTLTWQAFPEAARYEVWVNAVGTHRTAVIRTTTTGAVTSFTPATNLRSGVYQFQIRGIREDGGFDVWSDARSFQIETKISSVSVNEQFTLTPRLYWSESGGANSFVILITGLTSTSTRQVRLTALEVDRTLVIPALRAGEYRVLVRGIAADGSSGDWSSPVNFSAGKAPAFLNVPTELPMGSQVTIRWELTQSAHQYELWINDPSSGLSPASSILTVSSNSYVYNQLSIHGKYRFWVRALASDGTRGVWSQPLSIASRDRVQWVRAVNHDPFRPEIQWQAMPDAVKYQVTIGDTTFQTENATRFTPAENLLEGVHSITVTAFSADGTASLPSAEIVYRVFRAPQLVPVQSTPDPTVTLRWDDESDSRVSRIRMINTATNQNVLDITRIDAVEFHNVRLTDGTYQWMVFSQRANRWSAPADMPSGFRTVKTASASGSTVVFQATDCRLRGEMDPGK